MSDYPQLTQPELTQKLRQLMKVVGISSFKDLRDRSEVSLNVIVKLRQGQADLISYKDLNNLGISLKISAQDLIVKFSHQPYKLEQDELDKEDNSKSQFQTQIRQEFQQEVLTKLESLLLQLPTVAHAITNNPSIPAQNLLPLFRPFQNLLQDWGIEAIAPVGTEVSYDPRLHQLMDSSDLANLGDRALVRYIGYVQGDRLLYRARVSKIVTSL